MQTHPNAELWRKGQEAFSRRDLESLKKFWAEDIVYHFPGASSLAGDHRGLQAVLAFFAKLVEKDVRIVGVHDVLANDDHVAALVRVLIRAGGDETVQNAWTSCNVYTVRDGRIAEAWILPIDQAAVDGRLS